MRRVIGLAPTVAAASASPGVAATARATDQTGHGRDFNDLGTHSEHLLTEVDLETARIVGEAEKEAERPLIDHRGVLTTLAERLVTEETIAGDELDVVLAAVLQTPATPRRSRRAVQTGA